jgi:hypothetical protein
MDDVKFEFAVVTVDSEFAVVTVDSESAIVTGRFRVCDSRRRIVAPDEAQRSPG